MTKGEAVTLYNTLNSMVYATGARFTYAIAKNMKLLADEVQSLAKVLDQDEEMKAFEAKRIALAEKFAKKDDEGKPITAHNNYVMEDREAFEKEYEQLRTENTAVVEKYDNQVKEYSELLKDECDIKLHQVKLDDVPKEITSIQMSAIVYMIAGDE